MELIRGQMVFLAGSVVSGFAVMGCYEIVRVLRALFHLKTVGKFMLDTIYFLVAAVFVFQMVFLCNYGTLRIFFGIAFVMGAAACHVVLGRSVSTVFFGYLGNTPKIIQHAFENVKDY